MKRNLTRTLFSSALVASAVILGSPALAAGQQHHREGHRLNHQDVVVVTASRHHRGDRHHRRERRDYRYDDRHYYNDGGHHPRAVDRARRYASQATAQANTAWRLGCHRSGPRWTTDWNAHYYWALEAPPRQLRRETNRRHDRIQECRSRHHHYGRSSRHHRPFN